MRFDPKDLPERHRATVERQMADDGARDRRRRPPSDEVMAAARQAERERWELELKRQLIVCDVRGWTREFVFHPSRNWKFDFAFVECKLALEVEGGIWRPGGGAHSRPQAIERDIEKYNAALLLGWRVFRSTPKMIRQNQVIDPLQQLLASLRTTAKNR